jgi:hypothetical protein
MNFYCPVCGTPLTLQQRQRGFKCCSHQCRDRHIGYTEGLQEPLTDEAVLTADACIAERKTQVRRDFDSMRNKLTPRDDSPEAERRLRRELCGVGVEDEDS